MTILQTLMSYLSSHPQPLKQPSSSLHLAQYAPIFLSSSEATRDTQETWFLYEQLFLGSLRCEDNQSAQLCLQRLGDRFGVDSPRVRALTGLYDEATASSRPALEDILKRYNTILRDNPTNMPIEKRRITLLQSLGRTDEAITALTKLLAHSPTDAEAWSHLAVLYRSQGLYAQSAFCLEECLLVYPNAYNIHARLGETAYIGAANNESEALAEAARYFCRSVELCEWYLRGWYGLRLVTDRMLANGSGKAMPTKTVEGLNATATEKLAEIVRRASSGEDGWQGFDAGELEAAKELIAQRSIVR
jgi:tetratricopeptide (TPR) repeat protein